MGFFKRTISLDSIGVVYDELHPQSRDGAAAHGAEREQSERRVVTPVLTPSLNVARIDDVLSETSTTAETRTYSSSYPVTTTSVRMHHLREASGDFTFTGQPRAVVHFRSCITANDARSRLHARAGRGGDGDGDNAAEAMLPVNTGPFSADIVCIILLYVDTGTHADIVQLGSVCRFWRFYANLAPHWTYFRCREWRKQANLPHYVRRIVAKTKVVTRDEYIRERMKVEDYKKKEYIIGTARHIRWCVATGIMVGVMLTANFVVAYFLGFLRTALSSDLSLGITTFVLLIVATLLEITLVIFPLAGSSVSSTNKHSTMRILAWCVFMLVCSMVLGTISALAFTRVRASRHVLDGPTIDLTMSAPCEAYSSKNLPSFVLVPAELSDLRWRPITLDESEKQLIPYCVPKSGEGYDAAPTCFVLMYFDANYSSAVFQNESALLTGRDVGTRYATSFDPFFDSVQISGLWCNKSGHPQVVALTQAVYSSVKARRDRLYPTTADWLDPSKRPATFSTISMRCSSAIHRETTENPPKSTELWYGNAAAWKWYYVPLVTTYAQVRSTFQRMHDHFLRYAFLCHIFAGVMWVMMLFAQIIFKTASNMILGVATTAALVCLNPLTMILSGALCVKVSDSYFMCDAGSGGALIGGGVGLTFLVLTIYVTARE
ncbi:hypothetical protein, conserved [Leishmania donovani]|uniref:F-box domain-containing protein n=1 Tax=Leishmania donovani TaxID=5661 RepID=E9BA31_LEIDO|nr:hypothetical protein, conserved [Leishmania donovani]AYU76587.1 hypothetical protein LdCL_090021000 [Leishmania donovani]CBZ32104.1 hypothetical protein, conserved [Leishmania donovani]